MQFGGAAAASAADRFLGLTSWLGASRRSRGWRGYLNAAIAVAVTVAVRVVLEVLFAERAPTYLVFLAPVFLAALAGGVVPALFATVVSWLAAHFFFVDPTFSFKTASQDWVIAGVFMAEGAAIAVIGGRLRSTVAQLLEREHQLASSEARVVMAQRAARIATYDWEPLSGRAIWSENAEDIMGMPPGTFRGTFEDSLRTVVAEDRPLVDAAVHDLFLTGLNEVEFRVADPDGGLRWIRATGAVVGGETGPRRVVGVMMDVSENRRAAEHSGFLADATTELASSLDYHRNVAGLADVAVPRFADIAAVVLGSGGEGKTEVVALRHRDPERQPHLQHLQAVLEGMPDRPGLVAGAIRSGRPWLAASVDESQLAAIALSDAHLEALRQLHLSSAMCVPLTARGNALGGLVFATDGNRTLDESDYALALEVGRRASLAIENALLLEQSFQRETDATRANAALQLLADLGMSLSATLELSELMNSVASLIVPRFADACGVAISEHGKMERVALEARSPALRAVVEALGRNPTPDRELLSQAGATLRRHRPVYLPEIPEAMLSHLAASEPGLLDDPELKPRSLIVMPLAAHAQALGAMVFLRVGDSPPFDREALSLAGQIARRTAISADNALLYAEARRANDAKDEFLGMMSHELRTPITVIHGGARVLRSRAAYIDEETRAGLLADIERESERLSRMLENLLALARAELDRDVVLEPVLLQRLVPKLVDSLSAATGRELVLRTDAEVPAVAAEPGYIEHIVRNLVSNAVKYSPPNAPIEVVLSNGDGGASIRVLDRGFGVPNEEVTKIFERFYRSDRTSRLAGGAGLGLAVCKRLVEAMSGEIWAAPREGGGLEVGVSLPPYREEEVPLD